MKARPDLNQLAKDVYKANKAKGFHDKEQSNETLLMLVITELSEAVEADRSGKRANVRLFNAFDKPYEYDQGKHKDRYNRPSHDAFSFNSTIKDSIEDELADAVIRLLDLAGLRGIEILQENFDFYDNNVEEFSQVFGATPFATQVWHCIYLAIFSKFLLSDKISEGIAFLEAICNLLQIDIWLHVELKLKYNQTRPQKHGKEY